MPGLDRWFRNQLRKQQRAVCVEDALLARRFAAYAFYRLRFFLGQSVLATLVHVAEFLFLSFIFSDRVLIAALVVRAATSLLNGWWWGGLEVLREEIRDLHRNHMSHRIETRVSQWLVAAMVYAVVILVLVLLWVSGDALRASGHFSAFHLYVLANAVRLSSGMVARTYHSGIYALRRIYRPFWAIVLTDLLGLFGALVLWPLLGNWSFPCMLIASTALVTGLTLVFTSRTYQLMGLHPRPSFSRGIPAVLKKTLGSEFHAAGLSAALMRLDGILLFALFPTVDRAEFGYELFLLVYLISPLIRSNTDWAYLFYFDLKRLDVDLTANFNRRFERCVSCLSIAAACLFWTFSSIVATVALQRNLGWLYLLFAALFLMQSRVAAFQVRAFAQRDYGSGIRSGLVLLTATSFVLWFTPDAAMRIGGFTLALGCALLCLCVRRSSGSRRTHPASILPLPFWLEALKSSGPPVRLRSAALCDGVTDSQINQLARNLSRRLASNCRISRTGRGRIIWSEPHARDTLSDEQVVGIGAGWIEALQTTDGHQNGWAALQQAQRRGLFGKTIQKDWLDRPPTVSLESVRNEFLSKFPEGLVHEPRTDVSVSLSGLASEDRREILRGALQNARDPFGLPRGSRFEVSTLCSMGAVEAIFCVSRSEDRRRRAQWRRLVRDANMRIALGTLGTKGEVNNMYSVRKAIGWAVFAVGLVGSLSLITVEDRVTGRFEALPIECQQLQSPLDAFVDEVYVREGTAVERGALIARLDAPDLESRIAQTEASIDEARAGLRMLESGSRDEELAAQRRRVEQGRGWRDAAQEKLTRADASLQQELVRLAQAIAEHRSLADYAERNFQLVASLKQDGAISTSEFLEAKAEHERRQAQVGQVQAEMLARESLGTADALAELGRSQWQVADAEAALDLMEAGSREEQIDAARAVLNRLQANLSYLEDCREQLEVRSQVAGVVVTPLLEEKVGQYLRRGDPVCKIV